MSGGRALISFYGDDVTGSTDALESLSAFGLDTLLFLGLPSAEECRTAAETYDAVGIAGTSRSKSPAWMDAHLPDMFARLRTIAAPIAHYKICSTFDSAPEIGNIGRAIEIGRTAFDSKGATPIVVGAPTLGRYTAFGNLFARAGSEIFRIDRHPTMARHPVTPMHEADLLKHLALQTSISTALFDFVAQRTPGAEQALEELMLVNQAVLLDVLDAPSQLFAGQQLWRQAQASDRPLLCVGSSGVGAALIAHWLDVGRHGIARRTWPSTAVHQIAVVSGSCSPATAAQIGWAGQNGFDLIKADPIALVTEGASGPEAARLVQAGLSSLSRGGSPIVFTAEGPDDEAVASFSAFSDAHELGRATCQIRIGELLGEILRNFVLETGLSRVAVAGGDTSGAVTEALGIRALRMQAAITPGAPLCSALRTLDRENMFEIALKGGQMGPPEYFGDIRNGRA